MSKSFLNNAISKDEHRETLWSTSDSKDLEITEHVPQAIQN